MSQLWNIVRWLFLLLWTLLAKIFAPRRTRVVADCESDDGAAEDSDEDASDEDAPEAPPADTLEDVPPIPWHEAVDAAPARESSLNAGNQSLPAPA